MDIPKLQELFVQERRYLHNVSPKTLEWYKYSFRAFEPYLRSCPPEGMKQALKAAVIALRQNRLQPVSLNDYIRAVNAFLRWAKDESYLPELIRLDYLKEEQKLIATLSAQQVKRIADWKPVGFCSKRLHTLCCLLLDTGLRFEEALALHREDIDLDNLLMRVRGKGGKHRVVPIVNLSPNNNLPVATSTNLDAGTNFTVKGRGASVPVTGTPEQFSATLSTAGTFFDSRRRYRHRDRRSERGPFQRSHYDPRVADAQWSPLNSPTVTRSSGMTVTWTGGGGNVLLWITAATDSTNTNGATAQCTAPAGAQNPMTVPPYIMLALPTTSFGSFFLGSAESDVPYTYKRRSAK